MTRTPERYDVDRRNLRSVYRSDVSKVRNVRQSLVGNERREGLDFGGPERADSVYFGRLREAAGAVEKGRERQFLLQSFFSSTSASAAC